MANKRWVGRAQAIAQVDTITIATGSGWSGGDKITITINDKDLVITIQDTTLATIATTIKEAWENETLTLDTSATFTPEDGGQDIVEFAEITATVSSTVVTLTHDTPGVPFTLTAATDGTGSITAATSTSATGPNFWNNVDNWDTGSVPGAGDDVFFDNSDISVLYALDQPSGTITSMTIAQNYTGNIGLPKQNAGGYVEYRDDFLQADITTLLVGRGPGSGSGRIKIDLGSVQNTATIENTGNSTEFGLPAVILKGTHASNSLEVHDGSVGVALFGGESSTVATLIVSGGAVEIGDGVGTITTASVVAGTVRCSSQITTLTMHGGTFTFIGSSTVGTLTQTAGTMLYSSSGTITQLNLGGPGGPVFDCSGDASSRTITDATLKASATIIDPFGTITYTNAPSIDSSVDTLSVQ